MRANMGTIDRAARTALALVIIALLLAGYITGALAVTGAIVAAAFLLTSAVGWCPVYVPLGLSTRRRS